MSFKDNLKIALIPELDLFTKESKEEIPNVTKNQKKRWLDNISQYIIDEVNDSALYFDNMPDDVELI